MRAPIGVIGGSGFYELLDDVHEQPVDTPFGAPAASVAIGEFGERQVAFLPRHGADHRFPPHRIPYRANLWALASVGVREIVAPTAVGSLRRQVGPGSLVVPDQVVDRTHGRAGTFYDDDRGAVHVAFADPYCPSGRNVAVVAAQRQGWPVVDGGTLVVIEGPRFSSRAESQWYAAQGWTVIGMTGLPEAALARELALCYTPLALVTDFDAGVSEGEGVTQDEVFRVFAENVARLRDLVLDVVAALPEEPACSCRRALDGLALPLTVPGRRSPA